MKPQNHLRKKEKINISVKKNIKEISKEAKSQKQKKKKFNAPIVLILIAKINICDTTKILLIFRIQKNSEIFIKYFLVYSRKLLKIC